MALVEALVFLALLKTPTVSTQPQPTCLHDRATESQEEVARRRRALGAARLINTAESRYAPQHGGAYASFEELGASQELAPVTTASFEIHLDATVKGYWFEVVDTMDPCGFRYISNQMGVIFEAQPIR